jgi:predicted Rossmann fold flavoprotein
VNWLNLPTDQILERLMKAKRNNESWQTGPWQDIGLPKRLREFMLEESGVDRYQRWADVPDKKLESLAENITAFELQAKGKTTFKEEFVTCGGIDLKEVYMKTMESRLHPHLYFCGEILDIDAVTGGFNFQAAWTTAWHAAQSITST